MLERLLCPGRNPSDKIVNVKAERERDRNHGPNKKRANKKNLLFAQLFKRFAKILPRHSFLKYPECPRATRRMNGRRVINGTRNILTCFPRCASSFVVVVRSGTLVTRSVLSAYFATFTGNDRLEFHASYTYKSHRTLREINKFQVFPQCTYKHDLIIF